MLTRIRLAAALAVALVLARGMPAAAYEGGDVPNGGEIAGTVRYTGPLIPPLEVVVPPEQKACGATVPSHLFRVGQTRGLRDVIVTIEGITSGKPITLGTPSVLSSVRCQFEPHVQAVPVGTRIELLNDDLFPHNAHGVLDGARTLFNVALPMKGFHLPKVMSAPGLVTFRCEAGHTWSVAYILVLEHPYSAVTDSMGAFSIDKIPPGNYRVKAWHELGGAQEREVTVHAGSRTDLAFEYVAAPTLPSDVRPTPPSEDEF